MSNCIHCGDDLSGEQFPTEAERDCAALQIGRRWLENSSLELWFPITAEQIAQLTKERDQLAAQKKVLVEALQNCIEHLEEVHTGEDFECKCWDAADKAKQAREACGK